ncbi:MAG TPA: NAD+ synthase [Microthrixaceae bacterium]|nr:NAD+ synthase [Microthrixaceae bacterium]
MTIVRIALCQINPTVGALVGNTDRIIEVLAEAESAGAHLAVFGELALCGYPPEDLVLKRSFVADCEAQLQRLAAAAGSCGAVVGLPTVSADGSLRNTAAICRHGRVEYRYDKQELPTYGPFDEDRWFRPGQVDQPLFDLDGIDLDGIAVGVSVCEDIWIADGPVFRQGQSGARLLVNINASPYHHDKLDHREEMLRERSIAAGAPIVYVNQVGGQDELVFDGGSFVVGDDGELICRFPQFVEHVELVDIDLDGASQKADLIAPPLDDIAEIWHALVMGTRDYVHKNGFSDVVIGLSGGVDSSIVAAIAVDAFGPEHVHGVLMPSRFSSDHSISDAVRLAETLGIDHRTIPIEPGHLALETMLAESFAGRAHDLTEENLQSRIRGITLMALSNKFGWMVLTTGNKSESAVGYSTLYGDTAGAIAVIKDVYKTHIYRLCRWRNSRAGREIIPESVLTKAPSAELRPDQRDDQSLPPYDVLDAILYAYIEGDRTLADLIGEGYDPETVERICRLVDISEYKRRQSPFGLRVSSKSFGKDRRIPMTNRYR